MKVATIFGIDVNEYDFTEKELAVLSRVNSGFYDQVYRHRNPYSTEPFDCHGHRNKGDYTNIESADYDDFVKSALNQSMKIKRGTQ